MRSHSALFAIATILALTSPAFALGVALCGPSPHCASSEPVMKADCHQGLPMSMRECCMGGSEEHPLGVLGDTDGTRVERPLRTASTLAPPTPQPVASNATDPFEQAPPGSTRPLYETHSALLI